jgi:sec-independent protein translocase protein TatA
MFGIGMPELIVILLIVLIIFGAGKLPEIGTGLGRAIRGFKKGMSESDPDESKRIKEGDQKDNSSPNK